MSKIGLPKFLIIICYQKLSVQYNSWKNGWLQLLRKKITLKNGWLQLNLKNNLVGLKKWMVGRYSSLPIKWHSSLKNGQLQVRFSKEIYCLHKNFMLQGDPLDRSYSQKLQYPKRKLRLWVLWKKQFFGECKKTNI